MWEFFRKKSSRINGLKNPYSSLKLDRWLRNPIQAHPEYAMSAETTSNRRERKTSSSVTKSGSFWSSACSESTSSKSRRSKNEVMKDTGNNIFLLNSKLLVHRVWCPYASKYNHGGHYKYSSFSNALANSPRNETSLVALGKADLTLNITRDMYCGFSLV